MVKPIDVEGTWKLEIRGEVRTGSPECWSKIEGARHKGTEAGLANVQVSYALTRLRTAEYISTK
jgi:hypothetical protein